MTRSLCQNQYTIIYVLGIYYHETGLMDGWEGCLLIVYVQFTFNFKVSFGFISIVVSCPIWTIQITNNNTLGAFNI